MRWYWNLTHKTHLFCWFKRGNRIYKTLSILPSKLIRNKYVYLKKEKAMYAIPNLKEIQPLVHKYGIILVWDADNAISLDVMGEKELLKQLGIRDSFLDRVYRVLKPDDNQRSVSHPVERVVEPDYFVRRELDPTWLHDTIQADIVHDILAEPETNWPLLIWIIVSAVAVIGAVAMLWMVIHGAPAPVVINNICGTVPNMAMSVTPNPTPYPIYQHAATGSQIGSFF